MTRYKNLGRNSGVVGYDIGPHFIEVEFENGWIYRYSYTSTGRPDVERMKELAEAGKGLNRFIATRVGKRYESKRRR